MHVAIEGAINKAGVPQVKIHKLNALVGSISQAFMLLIFGMTRTPWIATTAVRFISPCQPLTAAVLTRPC